MIDFRDLLSTPRLLINSFFLFTKMYHSEHVYSYTFLSPRNLNCVNLEVYFQYKEFLLFLFLFFVFGVFSVVFFFNLI